MIDYILDRYAGHVDAVVLVVAPEARPRIEAHLRDRSVEFAEQASPTGMLDAILAGRDTVGPLRHDRVWITWCDQVGISASTVSALAAAEADAPDAAVILPTVEQTPPYIHFDRDASGRLTGVRQRREGDTMPDTGLSDAGLFSLSRTAFHDWLPEYAGSAPRDAATGERNFLPFIPWVSMRARVVTFPIAPEEARGVNTPADLAAAERWLA